MRALFAAMCEEIYISSSCCWPECNIVTRILPACLQTCSIALSRIIDCWPQVWRHRTASIIQCTHQGLGPLYDHVATRLHTPATLEDPSSQIETPILHARLATRCCL